MISNRRKQAVLDFNKALWVLRSETPNTEQGTERLIFAVSMSLSVVCGLYDAGVSEADFFKQMDNIIEQVFTPEAKA